MSSLFETGPQLDGLARVSGRSRPVRLLVDTGAQISLISELVLEELRSLPEASIPVAGLFSTLTFHEVHVVSLDVSLTDGTTTVFEDAFLTAMPALDDGVDGLIGRDILGHLRVVYDGVAQRFTLTR